jgi:hypothetical protein
MVLFAPYGTGILQGTCTGQKIKINPFNINVWIFCCFFKKPVPAPGTNFTMIYMKHAIRFIIGFIFILSGASKAVDTQSFIGLIQNYDIDFLAYGAILIPPLEIIAGLCLLLNIQTRVYALLIMVATIIFTLMFLDVLYTKGITDCGCFGSIDILKFPPWGTVLRNVLIIAGAFILYKYPLPEKHLGYRLKIMAVSLVGLLAFAVSGVSYAHPLVNVNTINLQDLTGENVNDTFLKHYHTFDKNKRYAVFIFSPTCFHCWDMTNSIKTFTESGYVDETIAFAPAELMKEEDVYERTLKPNFKVNMIPFKQFNDITSTTPVVMIIQNNKVVIYNNTGQISSGYTMKQFFKDKL